MTSKHFTELIDLLVEFKDFTSFLIRLAFVLGNLTTYYDEARYKLGKESNGITKTFEILLHYLDKDEN